MRKNKKGFTLVELVIVIAVIAILAAVLLPTFSGIITRARLSSVTQRAESVRKEVLGQYFDTAVEMKNVQIIVHNDTKNYTYTVAVTGEDTLAKATWTANDPSSTTANALPDGSTTATAGQFYRTYGEDVLVIIPADAHFGTNVSVNGATPDGLTKKGA